MCSSNYTTQEEKLLGQNASKVAWFNCCSGFSGDMALGCLIDAGADPDEIRRLLSGLEIGKWSLNTELTERNSIAATKVQIDYEKTSAARKLKDILAILETAKLPGKIAVTAAAAFHKLAEAEGKVHNRDKYDIHFHELGAQDTIIDIVGTLAALEILGIAGVYASPVATGYGTIYTEHGTITNPGPAVLEILKGIPLKGTDTDNEIITPTGAVLLATTVQTFGPIPPVSIEQVGYGAGSRIIPGIANLAQVIIGQAHVAPAHDDDLLYSQLLLLETNLDDITGENLSFCLQSCLETGALDAWITPTVMKKGRPGNVFSCLTGRENLEKLMGLLFHLTGTFGVRVREVGRYELQRHFDTVFIEGYELKVKTSQNRIKIEFDDVKVVSAKLKKPPREVIRLAESAWHDTHGS